MHIRTVTVFECMLLSVKGRVSENPMATTLSQSSGVTELSADSASETLFDSVETIQVNNAP